MFIDTAKVLIAAGKGGNGAVSFRHEIYIPRGGPDGGDGGKGGDVVFVASKDCNTLIAFRYQPELRAQDGRAGAKRQATGRSGEDLIVEVPIGTVVKRDGETIADLVEDEQRAIVAKGGDGGFGNAHFKSSVRQAPKIAEVGEPGESFEGEIELKLLADVGLIGFPNAGKSTFLSVVSGASPKIADYPFTTLTPSLGVATIDDTDILIADIPGLIEGASEGKGLGDKFLRHVERNQVLLHLIDVYVDNAGEAYRAIRKELVNYSDDLVRRPEIVALTKVEGVDKEIVEMQMASILAANSEAEVYAISSAAHEGLTELLRALKEKLNQVGYEEDVEEMAAGHLLPAKCQRLSPVKTGRHAKWPLQSRPDSVSPKKLPVITLTRGKDKIGKSFKVKKVDDKFVVTGEKIEKFARRTDYDNYDSVNRLRDIMKKMGIRGELTNKGALPDSIIEIAEHQFTLVEQ